MTDYNDIPIEYCDSCLDIKILKMPHKVNGQLEIIPYCGNCGSGQISINHVENWEELYYDRYGYSYIERITSLGEGKGKKGIDSLL